jgi:hypothetical protein
MEGSEVIENSAVRGSALYLQDNREKELNIKTTTFKKNTGEGVIYVIDSTLVMTSCTITGNEQKTETNGIVGFVSDITTTS